MLVLFFGLVGMAGFFRSPAVSIEAPNAVFGGVSLTLDYATTTEAREKGLSGRTNVPYGHGMLFIFPTEGRYGFWMKDTLVPLDIFWLNPSGGEDASELTVVSMSLNVATSSYPTVFYPTQPATYVLETAAGFGALRGISTGTPLRLQNWPAVSQ